MSNLMTGDDKYKIISNDFADLLVQYNDDYSKFDKFRNGTANLIDSKYAVVHIPFSQISRYTLSEYGYSAMPLCYGLTAYESLEASGVLKLRNVPGFSLRGEGVLIGIIDTGIDYTNPVFQHADKTTKIAALWDQTIDSREGYPQDFFYGTEYTRDKINEALKSDNPFDIVPSKDEIGHGTMLAGIAGGSENKEKGFSGVAPDSEFLIVKLKPAKQVIKDFMFIPNDAVVYQENDIMFGIRYMYITSKKLKRPIAICLGLGSSQGGHAGNTALEDQVYAYAGTPEFVITVAAGNEGAARAHYYGVIDPKVGYDTVELNVGENTPGFAMELWASPPSTVSVDIKTPTGELVQRLSPRLRVSNKFSFVFEKTIIYVDYQLVESNSGDELIMIRFENPTKGLWQLRAYEKSNLKTAFHIWLPMEKFIPRDTYFVTPNPYTTVLSPGNSNAPIVVTAYNVENGSLYLNASKGYTRNNVVVPALAAPGVNVLGSALNHEFSQVSGTSVAAAHTAGAAAMMLDWAIVKGNYPYINTAVVKKFMLLGADRESNITYPNPDWGYGKLDIFNIFDTIRKDIE